MQRLVVLSSITFAVLASIIIAAQLHFPSRQLPISPINHTSNQDIHLTAENSQKLSPNLQLRLSQSSPETNPQVNIFLRTTGTLQADQQSQLEGIGVKIRTIAGDIVTASTALSQISELAEFEFIRYIELSGPLYPESP